MQTFEGRKRTKRIVFYALGSTLLLQMAFSWLVPWWHPDLEFRFRKEILQARIAEQPEQPLFVFVGSSHVVSGFDPHELSGLQTPSQEPILSFNFAHLESGPVSNLLQVKRLLQAGIKPRWLLVEVMPSYCTNEWTSYVHLASWNDLDTIADYHSYRKFSGSFLRNHFLVPWHRHRADLQDHYLPEARPRGPGLNIDSAGWVPSLDDVAPEHRRDVTEKVHQIFGPTLTDRFQIAPSAVRAYRELLALCQREEIAVALILTPEGETFRSWYSPAAEERLAAFLSELRADYSVPVFDTRTWLDDTYFIDSHHLLNRGTRAFTQRLERELIQPWIREKALPNGLAAK